MLSLLICVLFIASVKGSPATTGVPSEDLTTTAWWTDLEDLPALIDSTLATESDSTSATERDSTLATESDNETDVVDLPSLISPRIPPSVRPRVSPSGCDGPGTACVPYYQCSNGSIITDGTGIIDIRFGDTVYSQHANCPRYLEVCCRISDETTTTPPTTPPPHVPSCGVRNPDGIHARITGLNNTQTQFGEFPWMVAILRIENIGGKDVNLYLCGGSLLFPNVVLTAAHCVRGYGTDSIKVRAGEWDTQSTYEIFPHQDRLVNTTIIHPDFNGGSLWNDFAILILQDPFDLAPNVDTICLPEPSDVFKGVTCVATGWGKDKFGEEGRFQNILKQVPLTVVPQGVCENALRTTRLGEHFVLDNSFTCAGGMKDMDTCKGDGGSPLVCPLPGSTESNPKYFQAGIVAWGIGCGENGVPGVYANVVFGVNWIKEVVAPFIN